MPNEQENSLKSEKCDKFSFVTFVNKTHRKVDVLWLDYNGRRVKYATLGINNNTYEITTYETHPWIFRDSDTGDKLVVQGGQEVYYPVQWTGGDRTRVHIVIPGTTFQTSQTRRLLVKLTKSYNDQPVPMNTSVIFFNPSKNKKH